MKKIKKFIPLLWCIAWDIWAIWYSISNLQRYRFVPTCIGIFLVAAWSILTGLEIELLSDGSTDD